MNNKTKGKERKTTDSFGFLWKKIPLDFYPRIKFEPQSTAKKKQLVLLLKKNKFKLVDKSNINYIFKRIN